MPLATIGRAALLSSALLLLTSACGGGGHDADTPAEWRWSLPAGFAPPVVPEDNPMNAAKVALGRQLFYDARLSVNGTLSCAGCHAVNLAFADGRAVARGATGQNHPRNAPSLFNAAYQATLDWAKPTPRTLEEQMHTPLFGEQPIEMGVNDDNRATILRRLADDAQSPARFASDFVSAPMPVFWPAECRGGVGGFGLRRVGAEAPPWRRRAAMLASVAWARLVGSAPPAARRVMLPTLERSPLVPCWRWRRASTAWDRAARSSGIWPPSLNPGTVTLTS